MSAWGRVRAGWASPWVRWPVNVLCLVLMVPVLIWLSAWALSQDEPLREEVRALLRLEPPPQDPGNAYWDLLGLAAPVDQVGYLAGIESVARAFDRYQLGGDPASLRLLDARDETLLSGAWQGVCEQAQAACMHQMLAHAAAVQAWLDEHAVPWQRLLEAMVRPRWTDWDVDAQRVAKRLEDASALVRAKAMIDALQGQPAQALDLAQRSLWLCRRALAGTVMVPVKAAAQRCAARAWALASAMVLEAADDVIASQDSTLLAMTLDLHPDEWSLRPLVRAQMRTALPQLFDNAQLRDQLYARSVWLRVLAKPFLLPHATMHRYVDDTLAQAALLDRMPNAQLIGERAAQPAPHGWSWLRADNPVGMWILSVQPQGDALAQLRLELRALEGQRRLYALLLQCRRKQTLSGPSDSAGMASCAASAPEHLRNPFDGSAVQWDERRAVLSLPIPRQPGVVALGAQALYTPQLHLPQPQQP